jgi:hypothetical protein
MNFKKLTVISNINQNKGIRKRKGLYKCKIYIYEKLKKQNTSETKEWG